MMFLLTSAIVGDVEVVVAPGRVGLDEADVVPFGNVVEGVPAVVAPELHLER